MNKLILLLFVLVSNSIFALTPKTLTCSDKGTDVYLVNGISYDDEDVKDMLNLQIRDRIPLDYLESKRPSSNYLKFEIIYNHTAGTGPLGFSKDFAESVAQKMALKFSLPVDEVLVFVFKASYRGLLSIDFFQSLFSSNVKMSDVFSFLWSLITKDQLSELLKTELSRFNQDNSGVKIALSRSLLNGRKVILISESQGNLFVNTAIRDLKNGEPLRTVLPDNTVKFGSLNNYLNVISNVQIATPVNPIIPKATLSLNDEDIINLVFFDKPDWNFDFEDPDSDQDPRSALDQYLDHFLWSTYLNYFEVSFGDLPRLYTFTLQAIIDGAALLDSNCPIQNDVLPPVEYSADFGMFSIPVTIDATDTITALLSQNPATQFDKIVWDVAGTQQSTSSSTIFRMLNKDFSYPGTAKIHLKNGVVKEMTFDVDLTTYREGGPVILSSLPLAQNEWPNASAMDFARGHYYLSTGMGRLLKINAETGQTLSQRSIPGIGWVEANKKGQIIYLTQGQQVTLNVLNPDTNQLVLQQTLNTVGGYAKDPTLDRKRNILYYSLPDLHYMYDETCQCNLGRETIVAVDVTTGNELGRKQLPMTFYTYGTQTFDVASLWRPAFINSDGWLVRMGTWSRWDNMMMFPVLFQAMSVNWNPDTGTMDTLYYGDFFESEGLQMIDNRKNLAYAFMQQNGMLSYSSFVAIHSKSRAPIYNHGRGTTPRLGAPQISPKGHFIGVKSVCDGNNQNCTHNISRLLRSDDNLN